MQGNFLWIIIERILLTLTTTQQTYYHKLSNEPNKHIIINYQNSERDY
jgi:hypothetical protein